VGRLRRYLPPQLADLIVSRGDERFLESHRQDITVVFCDLRGFTAFADTVEPEEVISAIDAVTAEDVHRVAQEIIGSHGSNLALIGPFDDAERFEKLLEG